MAEEDDERRPRFGSTVLDGGRGSVILRKVLASKREERGTGAAGGPEAGLEPQEPAPELRERQVEEEKEDQPQQQRQQLRDAASDEEQEGPAAQEPRKPEQEIVVQAFDEADAANSRDEDDASPVERDRGPKQRKKHSLSICASDSALLAPPLGLGPFRNNGDRKDAGAQEPDQEGAGGALSPLASPCAPPKSPEFGIEPLLSPEACSPASPLAPEGPRIKGLTLVPVGGTRQGDAGYYAPRKDSRKWQFWSFDFLNGWELVADSLSPSQCASAAGGQDEDFCDVLLREIESENAQTGQSKVLFELIPLFGTGDEDVDRLVQSKLADKSLELELRDGNGSSLLICATEHRKAGLVRTLLRKGVASNTRNEFGFAALHYACYQKSASSEVAKLLLEGGAFPDIADNSSCTPLHYAASEGRVGLAALLLRHKARVDLFDCNGYTPLSYAKEHGFAKCQRLLESVVHANCEWKACLDPDSDFTYYYNILTGETTWKRPQGAVEEVRDREHAQQLVDDAMAHDEVEESTLQDGGPAVGSAPLGPADAANVLELAEALFNDGGVDGGVGLGDQGTGLDTTSLQLGGADDVSQLMDDLIRENEQLKRRVDKQRRQRKKQTGEPKRKRSLLAICQVVAPISPSIAAPRAPPGALPPPASATEGPGITVTALDDGGAVSVRERTFACFDDAVVQGTSPSAAMDALRPLLADVARGQDATVFVFGPGDAERGELLLGTTTQPGLLPSLAAALFVDGNQAAVALTQVERTTDGVFDLQDSSAPVGADGPNRKAALDSAEMDKLVRKGFEQRNLFSACVDQAVTRSHLVSTLSRDGAEACGRLTIVELAYPQSIIAPADAKRAKQARYVDETIQELGATLKASQRKRRDAGQRDALCELAQARSVAVVFVARADAEDTRAFDKMLHCVERGRARLSKAASRRESDKESSVE